MVSAEASCRLVVRAQAQENVLVMVPDLTRSALSATQVLHLARAVLSSDELVELERWLAVHFPDAGCRPVVFEAGGSHRPLPADVHHRSLEAVARRPLREDAGVAFRD